ncbi:MAG TPA: hypothetical protein VLG50_05235 [Candidatus Saccharimonadales bacterium]|nr:hypothetical protein [Candidatus Saccharimonadales bacterium]
MDITYRNKGHDKIINITKIPKLWRKYPTLLYIYEQRLLMNEQDLRQDDIIIDNAITVHNFENEKKEEYDKQMFIYTQTMTDVLNKSINDPGYTLDLLSTNQDLLSTTSIVDKTIDFTIIPSIPLEFDPNVPIIQVTKTVKTPKKQNIKLKLDKLEEDKILNVSKITEYGTCTSTIKLNKNKKNVFQTKDERIETNNYNAFITTLSLIKDGEKIYQKDILKAKEFFDIK